MVRILNGIWNPEAQPFEIWRNGPHFVKTHLKYGQKRPDFECPRIRIVGTIAIWKPDHLKWSDFRSSLSRQIDLSKSNQIVSEIETGFMIAVTEKKICLFSRQVSNSQPSHIIYEKEASIVIDYSELEEELTTLEDVDDVKKVEKSLEKQINELQATINRIQVG